MGIVLLLVALPGVVALALVLSFGGIAALVFAALTIGLVLGMLGMARVWDHGDADALSRAARERRHIRTA
jgi:hypothetical protein